MNKFDSNYDNCCFYTHTMCRLYYTPNFNHPAFGYLYSNQSLAVEVVLGNLTRHKLLKVGTYLQTQIRTNHDRNVP